MSGLHCCSFSTRFGNLNYKTRSFYSRKWDGIIDVGNQLKYTFVVLSTENTTLINIFIKDDKTLVSGGTIAAIEVGDSDSTTFTGTYIVTQADINLGFISNLAIVARTTPFGLDATNTSSDPTPCANCLIDRVCQDRTITPLVQNPAISHIY